MVWCDKTGGRLTAYVQQLVGKSLHPENELATFEQVCGDLWYFLLFTYCKLQHGHVWFARWSFQTIVLGNLMSLLRLEVDAIDQWQGSNPARGIERVLTPERVAQLNACVPASLDVIALKHALYTTAQFGREVCASIAAKHGWMWPQVLAEETVLLLHASRE
jgi:Streptomycin adenylyltransferase